MDDNLNTALAAFQAQLPEVGKNAAAVVPTKNGGAYGYKYADLASLSAVILPLLGQHGLSFTALPTLFDGRFVLYYTLHHTSGEDLSGQYPLPEGGSPQALGSAITYARRYCLCAVTGVAPAEEDDDAAAAEEEHRAAPARTRPRIPGPDHERLRNDAAQGFVPGSQRLAAVPADDPWYDALPPDVPAAEGQPGTVDPKDLRAMHMLFGKLKITEREERLRVTAEIVGRAVPSSAGLSFTEGQALRAELERRAVG